MAPKMAEKKEIPRRDLPANGDSGALSPEEREAIGAYLLQCRTSNTEFTQMQAGRLAGIGEEQYRRIENGQSSTKPKTLAMLATGLKADLEYVFQLANWPLTDELRALQPRQRPGQRQEDKLGILVSELLQASGLALKSDVEELREQVEMLRQAVDDLGRRGEG